MLLSCSCICKLMVHLDRKGCHAASCAKHKSVEGQTVALNCDRDTGMLKHSKMCRQYVQNKCDH